MTSVDTNYAHIEKQTSRHCIWTWMVWTVCPRNTCQDWNSHKPLECILKKSLISAPTRLKRMMLRLQKYDPRATYKKGCEMNLADTRFSKVDPWLELKVCEKQESYCIGLARTEASRTASPNAMSATVSPRNKLKNHWSVIRYQLVRWKR